MQVQGFVESRTGLSMSTYSPWLAVMRHIVSSFDLLAPADNALAAVVLLVQLSVVFSWKLSKVVNKLLPFTGSNPLPARLC